MATSGNDVSGAVGVGLLTPPGRGALAVVGIAGDGGCELADRRFRPRGGTPLAARADGSLAVGTWHASATGPGEELVVLRRDRGWIEVHCHGGTAAAEAVIASLVAGGGARRSWPELLVAGGGGVIESEARRALAVAAGPRAARILCRQLAGSLAAELERIAALPPPERRRAAERLLRAGRVGRRLTEPWRVVVAGPVNAGKSSLVNALAGSARSIVSAEPGTTRDLVTTRIVLAGWELELIDTAGGRGAGEQTSGTERAGIARAAEAVARADLVLRATPADGSPPEPRPGELAVITKADLAFAPPAAASDAIVTSAVTGAGLDGLADRIVAALVPEDAFEPGLLDGPVPFTQRQLGAIRSLAD